VKTYNGTHCPYCQSPHIESHGMPDFELPTARLTMHCGNCNRVWVEVYTLTTYEEVNHD